METEQDVTIVGCGPVGQLTALLLGLRGWRVTVVERWPQPYGLPRAVALEHDAARVIASAGLGERLAEIIMPAHEYEWRNAAGQVLLRFAWDGPGPSGWPQTSMFAQPDLEDLLAARLAGVPGIEIRRGCQAVAAAGTDEGAALTVVDADGRRSVLRSAYIIGCDGAGSMVRREMGVSVTDLGFSHDWLIVDVVAPKDRVWSPTNLQVCDPARPTTAVSGGPGRRRFEFMRMPGETRAELELPRTAWRLLEPWGLTPADTTLERQAVYTFRAAWADRWRVGRLLLAGDAAHVMPPFAGQGLCSGLRDAANLAWKMDLVLAGTASDRILDTYGEERLPHARTAVTTSVELGEVICVPDPLMATERDQVMGAETGGTVLGAVTRDPLASGLLHRGPDGAPVAPAGVLCPQGRVARDGRTGPFDDVVGTGFVLFSPTDPARELDAGRRAFCAAAGIRLVHLPAAADLDGVYTGLLRATGHHAALVRPDFHLFGAAPAGGLPALLDDLRAQLAARPSRGTLAGTAVAAAAGPPGETLRGGPE